VISASLGGAISSALLYPLEVVKTRMQSQADNHEISMISVMQDLYEQGGVAVFYHGVETSAFQSALEKALYFFAYTSLKQQYASSNNKNNNTSSALKSTIVNLLLGCVAEWAHLPVTLPVDAWTTAIQTCTNGERPMTLLLTLLQQKPNKFYGGLRAYFVLCWKPALQYTAFEQAKRVWVRSRPNKSLTAVEAFFLGMLARTISTILVFPFLRAKVIVQASAAAAATRSAETSVMAVLMNMVRANPAGLYQGLGPELTRGVLSAAIMMMLKELLVGVVKKLLEGRGNFMMNKKRQ
jgi:adenine nucleotide transporter 17